MRDESTIQEELAMSQTQAAVPAPIKTAKVSGRRELHFHTLQDCLADAEHMSQVEVRCLGNWSLGQILKHVAEGMHSSIDGSRFKPPLLFRLIGPFFKKRILTKRMTAGFQLPADAAKVLVPGDTSTEEGLKALRLAVERLQKEDNRAPSPFLGMLTREESDQVHLRHAELHLSFVVPVKP